MKGLSFSIGEFFKILIWGDSREINGFRVGIAGLNSAWSCANNEDKAKLWFGYDWQIAKVKESMGPVDFAISLLHHPGNWFTSHEDPSAMRRLQQEFAIVMHGHEHQEWVKPDSESHLILSAGASYESSWMDNGYCFGQLDLAQQQGVIRLRQWDSIGRGWIPLNIANKTKDGCWPLHNLAWIMSREVDYITDAVESDKVQQPAPSESAEEHYSRRYCQHVIDKHDVLELFGCDMRIHYGPGYRVYFTRRDAVIYLLLLGGDKSTQKRDIKRAMEMASTL